MPRKTPRHADESEVRAVIDALTDAVRARDVDAMLALCAPNVVVFDLLPPLAHEGTDAVERVWAAPLQFLEGPAEYEIERLDVAVGGDVAFAHALTRFGATTKEGGRTQTWLRSTLGFRRLDGRWKLVHQHVSAPIDMETGRALLDVKP
jgi:uncharacterized protein (TIGR02246 family)